VVTEPAPPVRSLRGDAPPALDQVISRCLQKDRNFRFANIAELAVMLRELGSPSARDSVERILHTRGACATVRILPPEAAGVPHAFVQPCAPTAVSQCGGTGANREPARTSGVVIGVSTGVLFLCVALGGGALLFSKRGAHAAATADSTSTGSSAAAATAAPPETTATAAAVGTALAPPPEPVAAPPDTAAAAVTASATTKPPAATARPVAKPNCNPPYYFDAKGSRIFKKECL
jgi:serine/threonine-protein kinase